MFSAQEVTYYTQGFCHLLSYCLYKKIGNGSIVEMYRSSSDDNLENKFSSHSLFCFDDNGQKFYLDICGRYTSIDHILSFNEGMYSTEHVSIDDIEKWWSRHSFAYTEKEKSITETFINDNLERLLQQPFMTKERSEEIKKKVWIDEEGNDISIEIDISEITRKILRGESIDFSMF